LLNLALLGLCVTALPMGAEPLPANATSVSSLFFNLNAGDSGSYSPSAPSIWRDLAGDRNGTIVGNLTYDDGTKALSFPGSAGSYVDMGAGFNDFGQGITIEFEGHFGAINQAWERIFDFGRGEALDNIWVGVYGGPVSNSLAVEILNPSFSNRHCISKENLLTANTFAKWTITLDGTSCQMYKNGVVVETQQRCADGNGCTWSAETSPLALTTPYPVLPRNIARTNNYIGKSNWAQDPAFDGAIKYVRIFTSALNSTEVQNNATTYTLTYASTNSDSGTAPSAQTGNGLITLAGNTGSMVKDGYVFAGWATAQGATTAIAGAYNLTADTTLHPVWVSIPSAPRISVSSASATSLSVSITPPAINADSVDGYRIERSTNGTDWTLVSNDVADGAPSHTITGLTTGTPYYVRVAAKYAGAISAYGYNWQPIYEVTSPKRNSGAIVYADGFGLNNGDAATEHASTAFTRVRYRMAATYGSANNYVDANFLRTLGTKTSYSESFDSLARLRVPTTSNGDPDTSDPNHFEIHANVSDLTVESNVSGVQNGKDLDGRLEIWPWNYETTPATGITPRTSVPDTYDDADSPILTKTGQVQGFRSEYGSFQLHRLSNTSADNKTIFAWNRHLDQNYQDLGFGQYEGTHSDWTFAAEVTAYQNQPRTNFNLKIFIDVPVSPVATSYTVSYSMGDGGSGIAPSTPVSVSDGSTFTTPANTFTRAGYSFAGWSDGTNTYTEGATYPSTGTVSGNVALTATWSPNTLTVTLDEHGGSTISDLSTQTGGSLASPLEIPTRDGYTFNGWFIASSGGTAISFPYTHGQTTNFTLHAQWTPLQQDSPNDSTPPSQDTEPINTPNIPSTPETSTDTSSATETNVLTNPDTAVKPLAPLSNVAKEKNKASTKSSTSSASRLPITGEQIAARIMTALMAIAGGGLLMRRRRYN
ncbi:MAG: hypothetical protein RIR69_977, partial [Actinomycetota bacterium]